VPRGSRRASAAGARQDGPGKILLHGKQSAGTPVHDEPIYVVISLRDVRCPAARAAMGLGFTVDRNRPTPPGPDRVTPPRSPPRRGGVTKSCSVAFATFPLSCLLWGTTPTAPECGLRPQEREVLWVADAWSLPNHENFFRYGILLPFRGRKVSVIMLWPVRLSGERLPATLHKPNPRRLTEVLERRLTGRWREGCLGGLRRLPWRGGSCRCRIWGTGCRRGSPSRRGRWQSRFLWRLARRRRR